MSSNKGCVQKKKTVQNNKTYFKKAWMKDERFKSWIKENNKNNTMFGCRPCKKDNLSLSNMAVRAVVSHMNSQGHKSACKSVKSYFTTQSSSKQVQDDDKPAATTKQVQLIVGNETLKAEIYWVWLAIYNGWSFNSSDEVSDVIQKMFPDSSIASSFTMKKDKIRYLIVFGLSNFCQDLLESDIKKSEFISVSFDESLNDHIQKSQMDIVLRFWKDGMVKTRYFGSQFLGHATAVDLKWNIDEQMKSIDQDCIIQYSSDGPNVNKKLLKDIKADRLKKEHIELIDIGTCPLHSIHGAFKNGAISTGWKLKEFLKAAYNFLKDSPARREDYTKLTGQKLFPKSFCGTRWVEDAPVAERMVIIFKDVKVLIEAIQTRPVSQQPNKNNKSFAILKNAVKDKLMVAKLEFFIYIAKDMSPFLTKYQSDQPLVPFLHDDLLRMIISLMKVGFTGKAVEKVTSLVDFKKADLTKQSQYLQTPKVNMGFGSYNIIARLKRRDELSLTDEENFRSDCRKFTVTILVKIKENFSLKGSLIRSMSCIDPTLMTTNPSLATSRLVFLLNHLVNIKRFTAQQADSIKKEYSTLLYCSKLKDFSLKECRLDCFYFKSVNVLKDYPNTSQLIKMICILSHGQAPVERGFSQNNTVSCVNLTEKNLSC